VFFLSAVDWSDKERKSFLSLRSAKKWKRVPASWVLFLPRLRILQWHQDGVIGRHRSKQKRPLSDFWPISGVAGFRMKLLADCLLVLTVVQLCSEPALSHETGTPHSHDEGEAAAFFVSKHKNSGPYECTYTSYECPTFHPNVGQSV
jgi:hypothetical protein